MTSIVVPISGGKDSQLCFELALDQFGRQSVDGLFCDTMFEHPKTYQHIEFMRHYYGARIDAIHSTSVDHQVLKHSRFPSGVARFCTDELKMRPSRDFYSRRARSGPFDVWYGMRTGESIHRQRKYGDCLQLEKYAPHELFPVKYPKRLAVQGVAFVLPILDWSDADVFKRLLGRLNPLYSEGFRRVGCFPCLASGPRQMAKAFGHDAFGASQSDRVIKLSISIGKDPMSSSGEPCGVCLI